MLNYFVLGEISLFDCLIVTLVSSIIFLKLAAVPINLDGCGNDFFGFLAVNLHGFIVQHQLISNITSRMSVVKWMFGLRSAFHLELST